MLRKLLLHFSSYSLRSFFTATFIFFFFSAEAQDYKWGRQFGDVETDRVMAGEVDEDGNSYVLGESNTYYFDLDPGPGEDIYDNNISGIHGTICFINKLDSDGNYVWGKVFNMIREEGDYIIDMKIGTDNNLYLGMVLSWNYTGATTIPNPNFMIVKMDLDGNELMEKSITNQTPNAFNTIHVSAFDLDDDNNIYLTGYFVDNVSLDNTNPTFNFNGNGWANYILKMNSNGDYLWKKIFDYGGAYYDNIKINPDGSINYIWEGLDETNTSYSMKLRKLNALSGDLIWEKNFIEFSPIAFHVANNGNMIVSGRRGNSSNPPTDVDPSSNNVLTSAGNFLVWYSADGDLIDLKEYPEAALWLDVIASDIDNNYYFAGGGVGAMDADPSANISMVTPNAGESICIKFNSSRNFESVLKLGSDNNVPSYYLYGLKFTDIKIKNGNAFYGGSFAGQADLDPSSNIDLFDAMHTNVTHDDGFLIKLGPCDLTAPTGNPDQYFCFSENATIQSLSPNSSSIEWYDSLTGGNLLANTTALINGVVYYASKSIGSCTGTPLRLAVTSHISASPADPIVTNEIFCGSDNATLSSLTVSGQDLKWYDNLTTQTPLNATTALVDGTTYYVSQTVNSCESNRVPFVAVVNTTPLPIANATVTHCIQENKTLADITITGTNIQWYDDVTGGNLLPDTTLLENGYTYYASQTISGCESARIPVTATIQNTFGPTGFAVQYFCDTQALTLADFVVTGTNVVFYDSQFGGSILPMNTPLVDDMGYWASQTVNGCESSLRTPFISDIISDLPANDFTKNVCDDLNDGRENVDLSDYNEDIIPASSGYSFSYYTDFASADTEISANEITDFSAYEVQSGGNTIYVRVENSTLCYKVVLLQLNLIASPIVTMPDTYGICEGGSKTITAEPGFYTYTWSTGEWSQEITVTEAGTYSVTVTEYHGDVICGTTKTFTVVASNKATITSIETSDWNSNENMLTVYVDGFGEYEYSLDDVHYQLSNQFTGLANGEYMVYVRDINGCGVTKDDVYLLMYPKFFSPNADGYNDSWGIKFYQNEPNMIVKIFDRNGKFLKQLTDTDPVWDGTFNGQIQVATDYWFTVVRENGSEHTGHFSLKR